MANKLFLVALTFLIICAVNATAIDSWRIFYNKQVIFKGNAEMENPVVRFKTRQLKKTDHFVISYKIDNPDVNWQRTFYINDTNEVNIKTIDLNKQSGSVSVNASVLKEMMNKKRPVMIYTTSLPKDPSKAATVRVRRILLCKIEWY